jgi:hypothetical protein
MSFPQTLTQEDEHVLRDLYDLLEGWKNLTLAETASIHSDDWRGLENLRAKKNGLQHLIAEHEAHLFHTDNLLSEKHAVQKKRFRQLAEELSNMEAKNCELITQKMALADRQLKLSDKTIRSLRHIQQAYGTNSRSFWQAYS